MSQSTQGLINDSLRVDKNDEIDLSDLIRSLWRQRGLIVGVTLFSMLAVFSFHLQQGTFSTAKRVDYVISLNFIQNGKSEYPSGAPFTPSDLVAPAIIQAVRERMVLSHSETDIRNAIVVAHGSRLLAESEAKLSAMLSGAKTPDDVRLATSQVLAELNARSRGMLVLSVNIKQLGITPDQGMALVRELVDLWAGRALQRGLMSVDVDIPSVAFSIAQRSNLIDSYDNAASYATSLQRALRRLAEFPGSSSLSVDGFALDDVRRQLTTLIDTDISPLREFAYSNSGLLAESDPAIQVRLFARQRLLSLEHVRLTKLIESYDYSLTQLNKEARIGDLSHSSSAQGGSPMVQFDQTMLESMLQLGSRLGGIEHRNTLFERRTKTVEELLNLEKEIAILTGLLDVERQDVDPSDVLQDALQHIVSSLNQARSDLHAFVVAMREQSLNSSARVYVAQGSPTVRGGGVQLANKMSLYVALGLVLGAMLGMMLALIRTAMINSRHG